MTNRTADSPQLVYARIAGVAYILIIVIGVLSGTLIGSKLIVPGDDGLTIRNIMANELLFRIGIVAELVMYAGVLVLSAALYVVLEKVNRNLALLAMLLRSAEAIVGVVTVLLGSAVLFLVNGEGRSTAFDTTQLHALAGVFLEVHAAGLDPVLFLIGLNRLRLPVLRFQIRSPGLGRVGDLHVLVDPSPCAPRHPRAREPGDPRNRPLCTRRSFRAGLRGMARVERGRPPGGTRSAFIVNLACSIHGRS